MNWHRYSVIIGLVCCLQGLSAEVSPDKTVLIGPFSPYGNGKNLQLQTDLRTKIRLGLEKDGYTVIFARTRTLEGAMAEACQSNAAFLVSGYYRTGKINLELFGQIYDPDTGYVIDAVNVTDNLERLDDLEGLEGLKLDESELSESVEERMEELSRKIAIRIRSNPQKKERRFNIDENILGHPIGSDITFHIRNSGREESDDVFQVLTEQEITVASNLARTLEKQPVSVSVIDRKKIKLSGARTVNELLMIYVPGFFLVEDQDDVIAAFRGLAPDNNAKVLMLLNGQNINTEWFWGPPDSLLQGIDLEFIQRIEVIRGPGSVTLGQGALLGVINIVTRNGKSHPRSALTASTGKDGYSHVSFQSGIEGKDLPELRAYAYMGKTYYPGQGMRNEAYARDKGYEGVDDLRLQNVYDFQIVPTSGIDSRFEQVVTDASGPVFQQNGLSLVQRRTVYTSGNRLKRTDNTTAMTTLAYQNFELDLFYTDQQRDIYNFYRDRNEVQNIIRHANGGYTFELGSSASLELGAFFTQDDIILHSHSGFIMGGTREERYGGSALLKLQTSRNNRMALGAEYRRYDMGLPDKNGNNFIVNQANSTLLGDVNRSHQYVYSNTIDVGSFFLEDYYSITDSLDIFAAFRYDKQRYWGTNVSPRLGLLYSWEDLRFRLSFQEGFRGSPGVAYSGGFQKDGHLRTDNFDDIEAAGIPNPNSNENYRNIPRTRPEKMKSFELAANYGLNKNWNFEIVTFYNRLKDIIDVGVIFQDPAVFTMPQVGNDEPGDWNGFWFYKNNNGELRQVGAEFGINYRSRNLEFGLNHSVVRVVSASSQNIGGMYLTTDSENKHHRAYPENVTRLHLFYSPIQPLTLSLNYLFFPNWYSPNGNRVEGSQLLNAGLAYDLSESMEIAVIGKNLLDYTNPFPMNANAGGRDLSDGAASLEEATYWLTFKYRF
ncbi:MAG: TonB-dependent receptor plug domain-containing protein [Leptospiraceae bacterium]